MRIRLTIAGLSLLLSSNAWADLRIFDVGLQHQQEVYAALRNVLTTNSSPSVINTYGRVELLPNGQILVNAQPEALEQLEQVIKAIRERPVAAAPRVTLRYWAVLGTRAAANAAGGIGTPPPSVLNEVLAELRRLNGEVTFRVLGNAAVTSDSGQTGQLTAPTMSVDQTAHVQGDTANVNMKIHLQGSPPGPAFVNNLRITIGEIELRTTLQRGEFVVLGESQAAGGGLDGSIFYIVHWAE